MKKLKNEGLLIEERRYRGLLFKGVRGQLAANLDKGIDGKNDQADHVNTFNECARELESLELVRGHCDVAGDAEGRGRLEEGQEQNDGDVGVEQELNVLGVVESVDDEGCLGLFVVDAAELFGVLE